jgi:hypothetical protein
MDIQTCLKSPPPFYRSRKGVAEHQVNPQTGEELMHETKAAALSLSNHNFACASQSFFQPFASRTSLTPLITFSTSPLALSVAVIPIWPIRKYSVAIALCRPPATTMSFSASLGTISAAVIPRRIFGPVGRIRNRGR